MSDCQATREQLLHAARGQLTEPEQARFSAHLQSCSQCRQLFEREQALEHALERRPHFALPPRLREKLATQLVAAAAGSAAPVGPAPASTPRRGLARWAAIVGPALAAALLVALLVRGWGPSAQPLIEEAVSDHLRVLYAQHPIEIENGGIHQIKPWFAGKLDFAPVLEFSGDEEFPLQGGAIALFVDRKAATFIFKHRLHTASLFVFRSQGLAFPSHSVGAINATKAPNAPNAPNAIAGLSAVAASTRGFNVLLWQDRDLGYALVSDMAPSALARLAEKLTQR